MTFRVSIDSGGTFTDGILIDEKGGVTMAKAHTTPEDLPIGTLECLRKLATASSISLKDLLSRTDTIVHGSTIATNQIATRMGAKLGVIVTKGFRDRVSFPNVPKDSLYHWRFDPPKQLTRRHLMVDVEERVDYTGQVITRLNEDDVHKAIAYLKGQGVESIAVTLLHSYVFPDHECRVAEIIKEEYPEAYVTISSDVFPVMGEANRWSTTMFDAYVGPRTRVYVLQIEEILKREGFKGELVFMQNNGGIETSQIAAERPATLLLSGPAAGPSLGLTIGKEHGLENILSVDMGGTSLDIGIVVDGVVNVVLGKVIDWKKFALHSVDITTAGSGGGSIAWIDLGGMLQVGPHSAGASPGPACYARGGEQPTVTDADLVLGYIDPDYFLGGETKLKKDLAEKAIKEKIAGPLNLSVTEAAAAIYKVINASIASSIALVFTKRGYDPRDFTICAAGGAAPVHAARFMQELGIKNLIVPKVAPTYCAYGMLYCDLRHDYTRSYLAETDKADLTRLNELFSEMEKEAVDTLKREGVDEKGIVIEKSFDVRYYGQFRELTVLAPSGQVTKESLQITMDRFHEKHRGILGYSDCQYPTEIIRISLSGISPIVPPRLKEIYKGSDDASGALKGERQAFFEEYGDFVKTPVYDGDKLSAGNIIEGPCIIEEKMTTVVILPDMKIKVDTIGNYTTII